MSYDHILLIIGVLLTVFAASFYIRDTLTGKTTPNRVSWFLWALLPMIAVAAAIKAGADLWAVVRIFLSAILPLIIFFASFFNPKGYWHLTRFDWICGTCAILAIGVWIFLKSPKLSILFAILGDSLAALPTIYKAWKFPNTETGFTYLLGLFGVLLVFPSIPNWNIENSAFSIYLLVANLTLVVAIYRKRFIQRS